VQLSAGDASYIECDELDILIGLGTGELVVISQFIDGELRDRWIGHRNGPLKLRYIQPGEEIRILRLPDRAGSRNFRADRAGGG
jgi:hypothetical protein